MKIKYAFLDGTVTEVEVSDEIGAVIIDSRKAEHAQDERHRYHCYSYDAIDYEGEEYSRKHPSKREIQGRCTPSEMLHGRFPHKKEEGQ